MVQKIFADITASITDLKKSPMNTVEAADGEAVAILNHNVPAFYCVPADMYKRMVELIEDAELNTLADAREDGPFVEVDLSDL